MKNALNNQVGMLGDMFLWLLANLKQGVIYFIKQALPPNKSAGSVVLHRYAALSLTLDNHIQLDLGVRSYIFRPPQEFVCVLKVS